MEQWYSIIEYARKFNISDMTVRRRIKTGKIRAVLKEGKYYIPISDSMSSSKVEEPSLEKSANLSYLNSNSNPSSVLEGNNFKKDSSLSKALSSNSFTVNTPLSNNNSPNLANTADLNSSSNNNGSLQKPRINTSSPNYLSRSSMTSFSNSSEKNTATPSSSLKLQGRAPDTNLLLSNYNNMLQQFKRFEKILENSYNSKILHLESELKIQKIENANLKQQLEDLQVLIKLLEKK